MFGRNDVDVRIGATDASAPAFGSLEKRLRGITGLAKGITGALGFGFGARGLINLGRSAAVYADSVTDAMDATQTAGEALQIFRYLGEKSGGTAELVDKALIGMNDSAVQAAKALDKMDKSAELDRVEKLQKKLAALDKLGLDNKKFSQLNIGSRVDLFVRQLANAADAQETFGNILEVSNEQEVSALLLRLRQSGSLEYERLSARAAVFKLKQDSVTTATNAQAEAFKRLGIDIKKFSDLKPEDRMMQLAGAFNKASDKNAARSDLADILGAKVAPRLIGMIEELARVGMDGARKIAEDAGRLMTDKMRSQLQDAEQQINDFKTRMTISIGGPLAQTGSEFIKAVGAAKRNEPGARTKLALSMSPVGALSYAALGYAKLRGGNQQAVSPDQSAALSGPPPGSRIGNLVRQPTGEWILPGANVRVKAESGPPPAGSPSAAEQALLQEYRRTGTLILGIAEETRRINDGLSTARAQIKNNRE